MIRTSLRLETSVTFPLHVLHVLLWEPMAARTLTSSKLTLYVNVLLMIYSPSAISLLATDTFSADSQRSQNLPFLIVFLPYAYTLRNEVAIAHLFRCAGRVPYSTPLFGVLNTLLLMV